MEITELANQQEFLTIHEASEVLRTSARTIRRAIDRGKCKSVKITNRHLIHRKWLYAFALHGKTRLTPSEREEIEYLLKD